MSQVHRNNKSPSPPFPFEELKDEEYQQEIATSSLSSSPLFLSFTTTQDQRPSGLDHYSTHFHQNQQKVIDILHGEDSMKWICSKEEKEKYRSDDEEVVNNFSSSSTAAATDLCPNNDCSVRVCADCYTTRTPLWRGGPRGPKSVCNACGIRRRKAKRAAMASTTDTSMSPKSPKKDKKPRTSYATKHKKKKKKKLSFEEFALSLISKNSGFRQVFPQDEEEAAILLMALSCGLIHS